MTTKHRQRRNPFSKLKQKKKKQFFSILLKTWIDFGDRFIYIHPKLIALKNIQLYSHFHQTLLPHNGLVQRDFPRCLIISMDTLFFFFIPFVSFHATHQHASFTAYFLCRMYCVWIKAIRNCFSYSFAYLLECHIRAECVCVCVASTLCGSTCFVHAFKCCFVISIISLSEFSLLDFFGIE